TCGAPRGTSRRRRDDIAPAPGAPAECGPGTRSAFSRRRRRRRRPWAATALPICLRSSSPSGALLFVTGRCALPHGIAELLLLWKGIDAVGAAVGGLAEKLHPRALHARIVPRRLRQRQEGGDGGVEALAEG